VIGGQIVSKAVLTSPILCHRWLTQTHFGGYGSSSSSSGVGDGDGVGPAHHWGNVLAVFLRMQLLKNQQQDAAGAGPPEPVAPPAAGAAAAMMMLVMPDPVQHQAVDDLIQMLAGGAGNQMHNPWNLPALPSDLNCLHPGRAAFTQGL